MPNSTDGLWSGVIQAPGDSGTTGDGLGVFPMHAALLYNGKILMFAGHVETRDYLLESYVWDPTQPVDTATKQPFPTTTDLFCCHLASLEDGRVLVVGGAQAAPNHGSGIRAITVFDPDAPDATAWEKIGEMVEARWYPTLVALPNGQFVTFSGHRDSSSSGIAASVESFSAPFEGPGYTTQTVVGGDKTFPTYPGLHLVRGGRIFHTGPTWRYESPASDPIGTFSFRVTNPTNGAWTDHGIFPNVRFREEGMSVLLPPAQDGKLLVVGGGNAILDSDNRFESLDPASEPHAAEILDTRALPPSWTRIGDMAHPRINVTAVLLPDGKVLVIGGHDKHKFETSSNPSNQAEIYDPVLDTWTGVATMGVPRMYHSVALLLPDGRVWCGGGYDPNAGGDGNRKSMEFYQPPYFFNGPQPTIDGVSNLDGPPGEISYGHSFLIDTPNAAEIRRVALMRLGAITHHTDTEQRYVPLNFVPIGPNQLRAVAIVDPSVAPPGNYMLWIVDDNDRPCQQATIIKLTAKQCFVITDRSHISKDEVADATTPATTFENSFYVVMDGFLPSDLNVTTATPTPTQLAAIAPAVEFRRLDGTDFASILATPDELLLEDSTLPAGVPQRFTFKYSVSVGGTAEFFQADGVTPIELQMVSLVAQNAGYTCTGSMTLTHQPNPYMLDGSTSWLSIDLRVFQISEGESRFGQSIGSDEASAISFIQGALGDFNASPVTGATQFASISTDQTTSKLELAKSRNGKRIFNFAVAQVRFRGRTLDAVDVRVFFRAFTTAATGMSYRSTTTYRTLTNSAGDPVPGLGLVSGEIATIPFFGAPRVNTATQSMTEQTDPINVRTIQATGGTETNAYFGCWLDFNQTALRFPNYPGGDGPYTSGLKSVQQLIRGQHQCLIAEIHFDPDPIPEGASPGGNDNLSQRNLAIVESDNPGDEATRTVQHTFEIEPSPDHSIKVTATRPVIAKHTGKFKVGQPQLLEGSGLTELMIRWGDLPRSTIASIYLPDVEADEILELAALRIGPFRLEKVDEHTVSCRVDDLTYIPLPAGRKQNIPGLLTLTLPQGVKSGQTYNVIVHQVAAVTREILGSFELAVIVGTRDSVLVGVVRTLSVLKHIAESIPITDRWHPVFQRYVSQVADRVRGFGLDADSIEPSPDGDGGDATLDKADTLKAKRCKLLAATFAVFLGLLVVALGLPTGFLPNGGHFIVLLGLALTLWMWLRSCKPGICGFLLALTLGALSGAAVLGLMLVGAGIGVSVPIMVSATVGAATSLMAATLLGSDDWKG